MLRCTLNGPPEREEWVPDWIAGERGYQDEPYVALKCVIQERCRSFVCHPRSDGNVERAELETQKVDVLFERIIFPYVADFAHRASCVNCGNLGIEHGVVCHEVTLKKILEFDNLRIL